MVPHVLGPRVSRPAPAPADHAARRRARELDARLSAVRAERRAGRAPDRLGAALAWARDYVARLSEE